MRLLGVEINRFLSRRAVVLILLGAVLLTAVLAVTTIWETRPVSASAQAAAQAQVDAEIASPRFQRQLERCQEKPRRFTGGSDPAACEEVMTPRIEWYLDERVLDLRSVNGDVGAGLIVIVTALMLIVGTTFAGADWSSGSISNQVMFRPRRTTVWLAKAGAVLLCTAVTTAVVLVAFWTVMYAVADARGIPAGAAVTHAVMGTVARGVVLASLAAVGGFALTMLLRHTVGTLAVLFAYAAGGETLTSALPIEGVGRRSLSHNVFAWLSNGYQYYDPSLPCVNDFDGCDQMASLSPQHGAVYLAVTLVVIVVISVISFRRRDIA
jgi:hypothetical protein